MRRIKGALIALITATILVIAGAPAAQAGTTTCVRLDFIKVCKTNQGRYVKKCITTYFGSGISTTRCTRYKRY